MFPQTAPFQNFGERSGQKTSAAFLAALADNLYQGISVDSPLVAFTHPAGTFIGLERGTLDLRRFVLTATLKAGSSAAANLLTFDGNRIGDRSEEITVYDALGQDDGSILGRSGDYGLCKWHPDSGRFEIVRNALLGAGEDFFPAEILTRTLSSGVYKYGWRELEFATKAALPTTLSSGRSGDNSSNQPAIEINNQKVKVGAFVWMRRGYRGTRATASFTQTTSGNNFGIASAFSLYVDSATGGTYTLTLNSGTTTALAYNANSATVKSALETASGKTLSSFSGAGTLASPWTFSVSTDTANYFCSADGSALDDDSSYAFDASVPVITIDDTNTPTSFAGPLNAGAWYVYQTTGITLGEDTGDGTEGLRLLAATTTQQGAVSVDDQYFAGVKAFKSDRLYLTNDADFDIDDPGTFLHGFLWYLDELLGTSSIISNWGSTQQTTILMTPDADEASFKINCEGPSLKLGSVKGSTSSGDWTVTIDGAGSPRFAVGTNLGQTATISGLVFVGGILTDYDAPVDTSITTAMLLGGM